MDDELLNLLGDREENRVAFIAALIMERCKHAPDELRPILKAPRFSPYQAARIADKLASQAGLIKSLCEEACNRGLSPAQEATLERREKVFQDIARLIGLEARTGGDPRGACAYLIDPSDPKAGDGWGNGWAVYS